MKGPLILIASALFYVGSAIVETSPGSRGYSAFGGIPAMVLLIIGLRITHDERRRKD